MSKPYARARSGNNLSSRKPSGNYPPVLSARDRLQTFLARRYILVFICAGFIFLFVQTSEHLSATGQLSGFYFVEVTLTLLLLVATALLTRILIQTLQEKSQAFNTLRAKHELSLQLSASRDISEGSHRLVEQVEYVVPSARIDLYLDGTHPDRFLHALPSPAGAPLAGESPASPLPPRLDTHPCRNCAIENHGRLLSLQSCRQAGSLCQAYQNPAYCLPIVQEEMPIGLVLIEAPASGGLTAAQVELLENMSDEISRWLVAYVDSQHREQQMLDQMVRSVQLEIARDIHDTLGQNVGYLSMHLDRLVDPCAYSSASAGQELQRLSKVANESYDLVRGTLSLLQANSSSNLVNLFMSYAEEVAERSEFRVDFNMQGQPQPLSPYTIRQLFFVFRECLSNIEKHAAASQVCIDVVWQQAAVIFTVADNGRGFDLAALPPSSHYGLKFMRERIERTGGIFNLESRPAHGTTLRIEIPINQQEREGTR